MQSAYANVLNLNFDSARSKLAMKSPNPKENPFRLYVLNLADALEIFISDSETLYEKYAHLEETRLKIVEDLPEDLPEKYFLDAEIRIHWAFVKFRFGDYLSAFLDLRQAYFSANQGVTLFPDNIPLQKSMGVLHTAFGAVPQNYNWILSLAGINGNIAAGMQELSHVSHSNSAFALETKAFQSLFQTFLLNQKQEALETLADISANKKYSSIELVKAVSLMKNGKSREARGVFSALEKNRISNKMPILFYFLGQTYVQEHQFSRAIFYYKKFIDSYEGRNYIKDAYAKIAISEWLSGSDNYNIYLDKARNCGQTLIDVDKNAARLIQHDPLPHKILLKIRYATDGGFYKLAQKYVDETTPDSFSRRADKLEFHYRKARLLHKTGEIEAALEAYKTVIALQESGNFYFAPNSCLQVGYILSAQKKDSLALVFFEKVKQYKDHPYKYSIDKKSDIEIERLGIGD